MAENLKETIEELGRAFHEFKAKNDQALKEVAEKGAASAEVKAAVDKANEDVTRLQAKVDELTNAIRAHETAAARFALGGQSDSAREAQEKERLHAQAFFARKRGMPINEVQIGDQELEQYRAYKKAFVAHIRFGDAMPHELKAALNTGTATEGGLWVPPDTTGRIVELMYETSPMRQLAQVDTISSDSYEGLTDLNEADSGWVGEEDEREDSEAPGDGKWKIDLKEQYASPKTTQRLLDTSIRDPEGWLARKIADKLSRTENAAYVSGNTPKRPRGFLTYAEGKPTKDNWQRIEVIKSGAAGAFAAENPVDRIIDLVTALKPRYRANARFGAARLTFAAIRKFKDADGNYLWQPSIQAGQPASLLGYPTADLEDMPTIAANSLSLAFGDFKETYQIIDHTTGIRVLRDPFTKKPYVIFYTTKYTGGDVVNFEAMKVMKFAA